jgi:acetaldehyde dehydrogenase
MGKLSVAIIGSGNIGTDLLIKVMRQSGLLRIGAFVGIDPNSDGLTRAFALGVPVTSGGIEGLLKLPEFADIEIVFDATSASAHLRHDSVLQAHGKQVIDLTPAAIGPYTVPAINLDQHLAARNVNMVTCGGQATIPMVSAVNRVARVHYAEIVASIASKSAGPGTRANIDEFTETTARAIETVGGAGRGKAIIVLNPAEPPLIMRDTIYCLCEQLDQSDKSDILSSVAEMVAAVQIYVPGYRLKQPVQFEAMQEDGLPGQFEVGTQFSGTKISIFLEVEGSAHYLPAYAGNLDIMTSAALRTAERIFHHRRRGMSA